MQLLPIIIILVSVLHCIHATGDYQQSQTDIPVLVGLIHRTPQRGLQMLLNISDVHHEQYAKYLTMSQVAEVWGTPESKEVEWMVRWMTTDLSATRIVVSEARDFLRAFVPRAMLAPLRAHELVDLVVDLSAPSPRTVSFHIDRVTRMAELWESHASVDSDGQGGARGPDAQKTRMSLPLNQTATNPRNKQAVWGTGSYGYAPSDLNEFYQWQGVNTNSSQTVAVGLAGNSAGDNYVECTIDVQMITSMAIGVSTLAINTDNNTNAESGLGFGPAMLDFIGQLAGTPDAELPLVLSMSLGSLSSYACEYLCNQVVATNGSYTFDECLDFAASQFQVCMFSDDQEERMNVEFQKLGARGMTMLAASGDGGAHFSFQPFPKTSQLGVLLNEFSCGHILPTFPAASPFVTAVGGTSIRITDPVDDSGITSAWKASGGAFAMGPSFEMQPFQKPFVSQYLAAQASAKGFPPSGSFDQTRRAYPDISALSSDLPLVVNGRKTVGGGTSFAAPECAGVFSLLNDIRLNKGLPPLGWVSPRLYQTAQEHPGAAFTDIVQGDNACTSAGFCCNNGFPAVKGWDAASGLGELYWPGLVSLLTVDN